MAPWKNNPPMKRFNERHIPVPMCGCWIWTGMLTDSGYGMLCAQGKLRRAHVFAYKQFVGPVPVGMCVLHECDMRCCVNPDHLKLGTKKQNSEDAMVRKRYPTGEQHGNTPLTTAQVLSIRADTRTQRLIAADYGVCQMTISNIKRGATWKYQK